MFHCFLKKLAPMTKTATEVGSTYEDTSFKVVRPKCKTDLWWLAHVQTNCCNFSCGKVLSSLYMHFLLSRLKAWRFLISFYIFFYHRRFPFKPTLGVKYFPATIQVQLVHNVQKEDASLWLDIISARAGWITVVCTWRSSGAKPQFYIYTQRYEGGTCGSAANLLSRFLHRSDLGSSVW